MLRIRQSKSAAQAKKYFRESLSRGDYYAEGQEMTGQWGGKGGARLGLSGQVDRAAYDALCDNLHPVTGEQLTPRMKKDRRPGWDFNFNPPKSVSLAWAFSKDERIIEAHRRAVLGAMQEAERRTGTRVRMGGKDEVRLTGELTWAEHLHLTARPVDGWPDPHIHSHIYVFNFTFDPVEKRLKAAEIADIKAHGAYYQGIYLSLLETELRKLGLTIEKTGKFFEIAGISRSFNRKFSRRGETVKAEAIKRGAKTAEERDGLAALTREKKIKGLPISQLDPIWEAQLSAQDKTELKAILECLRRSRVREAVALEKSSRELGQRKRGLTLAGPLEAKREVLGPGEELISDPQAGRAAVDLAIKHVFHTRSVVTERELTAEALNWSYGRATLADVREAVKEAPLQRFERNGDTVVTTAGVVLEEMRIAAWCKEGHGKFPPLNVAWRIQDELLNQQQRTAVFHVLESGEFITGIVGKAGTGKTRTLLEAAKAIEATGRKVLAFAPTASAARGTLRESGFPEAETLAKLLVNPWLQNEAREAVWFVDEGGLMSTRTMDAVLALADKLGARVVLVGDPEQIHSVERGDAFRLLQNHGEMSVATIDIIQRQKGLFRDGVWLISKGRHAEAFEVFEQMNSIHEIEDDEKRYQSIAEAYVGAVTAGKSVLLVAPTHVECNAVTEKVRALLTEQGQIGPTQRREILRNLSWSPAEKEYALSYEPGLVVKVTGHMKGWAIGEELEVVQAGIGVVRVRGEEGAVRELPLDQAEQFSVYERDAIEIGQGERIRITVNSRTEDGHRLNNGDTHTIKQLSPNGEIVLENDWRLGPDFRFLDFGVVQTCYAAQSRTVDVVLVAQSGTLSMGAGDAAQFYSTIARGSKELGIYTDSLEGLRENVACVRKRELATELLASQAVEQDWQREPLGDLVVAPESNEVPLAAKLGQEHHWSPEIAVGAAIRELKVEIRPPELERELEMEL